MSDTESRATGLKFDEPLESKFCGGATVSAILHRRVQNVWTVSPRATVYEALQIMAYRNVGALIVTEGERILGVISERDYARKVILRGKRSHELPVSEIMSSPAITVGPENSVNECMSIMTENHGRHLPVVQDGTLVGCVSQGDLVKYIITEQEQRLDQYEAFLSTSRVA